jgi:transposase-like protein
VVEKARRRRFTGAYKLGILRQAESCTEPGELGALLRREGLYSSHLTKWRQQREAGALAGLTPKKRGRKARSVDPLAARVAELERENGRLRQKLQRAETIIEVQKKLSEVLGLTSQESESPNGGRR